MRRISAGFIAFVVLTATFLILPVYAAPTPEAVPVETSAEEIAMGSVEAPAAEAEVQEGLTEPVRGVPATTPTLTVQETRTEPFSLVGVTWAHDPLVTDTIVQVRVRDDAGEWGDWTSISREDADVDPGAASAGRTRSGTSPLWTGPSTGVEAELVTRSGAQPTDVQLDLVNPGTSAADTALAAPDITDTAEAAMAMPAVYSRAQWGADERLRTWAPSYAPTIKAATLHHTADSNAYAADDVPSIMRSIYRYHSVSLNWGDIGYNVIVDKFGRLWEGRSGGLASTVVGAHAGGFNTGTFGVSMLGNYELVPVPQATVDSVAAIIAWKFSLFGVDPKGTTVLTGGGGTSRFASGSKVTLPTVFGHIDVKATACPGRYGIARLGEIRDQVAARMRHPVTPEITQRYDSDAAARATLGAKVGVETEAAGVSWQTYERGALFFSPATGVVLLRGAVLARYLAAGGPASLGAPRTEERGLPDGRGVVAELQRGGIYWSPATDAHVVRGAVRQYWAAAGGEGGPLGYPVEDEISRDGDGAVSVFENGSVYWSPDTGAKAVRGGVRAAYEGAGGETGVLGYPISEEAPAAGDRGRVQQFESGSVYWTAASGALVVRGAVRAAWAASGGAAGPLGFPTTNELVAADGVGRVQLFEGAAVFWSPTTGAHPVAGAIRSAWAAAGADGGPLGYPTAGEADTTGGRVQSFQGGAVYWSASTDAHVVRGAIGSQWLASGGPSGPLALPTSEEMDTPGGAGRLQRFQGGTVYWSSSTAAHVVRGDIATAYDEAGGRAGVLGLPVTGARATADGAGRVQSFQGGSIYWSAGNGAHVVRGAIGAQWLASGGVTGPLAFPTATERDTPGGAGRLQRFENGTVYWSAATAAHIVRGDIATTYEAAGGVSGVLGLPTTEAVATADGAGRKQSFQGGSIYWSAATGAYVVRGAIGATWLSAGGPTGRLGYPTSGEVSSAGGAVQRFQGGSVSWSATTSATTVAHR